MPPKEFKHYTVMKQEVVDFLDCRNSDKIFVDCTLGGGGHSEEILKRISPEGKLISFDAVIGFLFIISSIFSLYVHKGEVLSYI